MRHEIGSVTLLVDDEDQLHANFNLSSGATEEMLEDIRTMFTQAIDQGIEAYLEEENNGD